ncbi:amidase [Methylobacterium nonmethylotrophicum]|uniref:Indoleacetamide hydrolase n=1 Tax=Methylobacterium nonmethylotrophicum TaxID=1141884 RepID=A0A4Z0NP63_9HYPH|nr:amidase [Methylobacterium nonmethylotrophicum]TGD97439.1 amidase [Methylobacterium nonmethylotrophicum]
MPTSTDLVTIRATDLARAIRDRAVSAREAMQAHLDQIARHNPAVTAIVSLRDPDVLLAEADAADRELAEKGPRGPLHGLPHAVKDLSATAGIRTTQGSPLFRDTVPDTDALHVARLRAAGAILIGKTNVPEFGLGSHSRNPVFGTTRNAYDPAKAGGGSSGGAAVALALRMVPLADGSDHGGSLRNPAAWNNVLGLRTAAGRVPGRTDEVFLPPLTVNGPMARCTADLGLLLSVQAGYDPRTPNAIRQDPAMFAEPRPRDLKGLRIGWMGDLGGHLPFEPGVLDLCEAGLQVFSAHGAAVEPVLPAFDPEAIWRSWVLLRQWITGATLKPYWDDPDKRALMRPEAVWEVEQGLRLSAFDVHAASVTRTAWYHCVRGLFERFDVLALPSAQVFPFDAEETWPRRVGGRAMDTYHRWMEVVVPGTLSGCPAISLPVGLNPAGLPMGIQLIAPNQDEASLLAIAAAYEAVTGFDRIMPPVLADRSPVLADRSPALRG